MQSILKSQRKSLAFLHAFLDDSFIVRAAILTQQKLKNIDRDIRPFLDFLRQVFPDNLTVKILTKLVLYFFTGVLIFCQ